MLKYIGSGSVIGVPARDLSEEEVKIYGGRMFLVGTGLYREEGFHEIKNETKNRKWPGTHENTGETNEA